MDEAKETIKGGEGMQVYELGFHIVPLVAEENLAAEMATIKSTLEKYGAVFITEDFPKMKALSYPMRKKIDATNHNFKSAYFGWVKFETKPAELPAIKSELDLNKNILRFLLIKTVRENTLMAGRTVGLRGQRTPRTDDPGLGSSGAPGAPSRTAPMTPISTEEMDKSIDELVIQ